jgi:hypothetical protein
VCASTENMEGRSELTKTQEPLEVHLHRPPEATSRHPCQPPACDTRPRVLRDERGLESLDAWTSTSCQTVTHFSPHSLLCWHCRALLGEALSAVVQSCDDPVDQPLALLRYALCCCDAGRVQPPSTCASTGAEPKTASSLCRDRASRCTRYTR